MAKLKRVRTRKNKTVTLVEGAWEARRVKGGWRFWPPTPASSWFVDGALSEPQAREILSMVKTAFEEGVRGTQVAICDALGLARSIPWGFSGVSSGLE